MARKVSGLSRKRPLFTVHSVLAQGEMSFDDLKVASKSTTLRLSRLRQKHTARVTERLPAVYA